MKRVIYRKPDYYIERPGNPAAALGSMVLGAVWLLSVFVLVASPSLWTVTLFVGATALCGVPAWLLADRWGARKRWKVARVETAVETPDGVALEVVDAKGGVHELVTDRATGNGLAAVFMRR